MKSINSVNLENWKKNGYIKINNFFNSELTNKLSDFTNQIIEFDDVNDKWMKWYELNKIGQKMVARVENFLDHHQGIKNILINNSGIYEMLELLAGEKVELYKEKVNVKFPGGSGFVPHQDIYDTGLREVDIVVMVAIDYATEANGCLKIYGNEEYKKGIVGTGQNGRISPEIYKNYAWDTITCEPGDIVVFDSYAPHYSEPNRSNDSRRAIFISFKKESTLGFSRENYYKNKIIKYPPESKNPDLNNLKPSSTTTYGVNDPIIEPEV